MGTIVVLKRRVEYVSGRPMSTMIGSQSDQHFDNIPVRTFDFKEYQRPSGSRTKVEDVDEEEEGRKSGKSDTARGRSKSRQQHETNFRGPRAWKVVDAKKILTKRKYVRKNEECKSADEQGTSSRRSSGANSVLMTEPSVAHMLPVSQGPGTALQGVSLDNLPVRNNQAVRSALDFLVHDIAAVAMPGAYHALGFSPKTCALMQLGLEYPMFFHAVIAFSQGYKEVATTGTTQPSSLVLTHRGMATQGLFARLKDPATRADDISILTAFLLVDNVWRYGETEIGRQHYQGLLNMVEARGGLDQLGVNGIIKAMIDFAAVTDLGDSLRPPTAVSLPGLRYCNHPFPAELCRLISKLPEGYTPFALHGRLSIEMITTIASLNDWLQTDLAMRSPAPHCQLGAARRCMAATKNSEGSNLEEAICLGVIVTSMRSFHGRFSRMDHGLLDQIVEMSHAIDKRTNKHITCHNAQRQHIAFLTLVAVEASEKCIELQGHVNTLVEQLTTRERFARSWAGMEKVVKKYLWIPFAADHWRLCWLRRLKRHAEAAVRASGTENPQGEGVWRDRLDPSLQ